MEADKFIHTSSAVAEKSELTINDLDDDSLGIIFNKLPCRDRTRIGSVCERWYAVSETNWCTYFKRLKIDKDFLPSYANSTENESILEEILQRGSPYVEEVNFEDDNSRSFEAGTVKRIVECSPRLKRLTVVRINLNVEDWIACSNLEALSIISNRGCCMFGTLFCNNKRLRRLEVFGNSSLRPSDFDYLDPGQLEFLLIQYCSNFNFTARLANKLAESLVDLKYDPLHNPYTRSPEGLQYLCMLKNLRNLNLKLCYARALEIQFIVDIAENCKKLERITFNIYASNKFDENFIAMLFKLPCLKSLVLILRRYEMRYKILVSLFRKAPNLKFFVLGACTKCRYKENNIKPCDKHSQSQVKNTNSVASNSNEPVIITKKI